MFQHYINKLIKNLPKRDKAISLDLVLDGGIFNGGYLIGALYFLKELERINYVKIKRISGCSVGAAVGLLYSIDKLDLSEKINNKIAEQLKQSYKIPIIKEYKELLFGNECLQKRDQNRILQKINKYLYVSYHKKSKTSIFFKKK